MLKKNKTISLESFEEFAHQSSLEVKRYNKRQVQVLLYCLLRKRQFTLAVLHLYSENRNDQQTSREVILCTLGGEGGNSLQCTIESSRVIGSSTKTAQSLPKTKPGYKNERFYKHKG